MERNEELKFNQANLLVKYSKEIDIAVKAAVKAALLKHKQANNPVAIWRNGEVVLLSPDEILPDKK
ncbi:MAG: hypothetical protein M3Q99_05880 [Acidobacteriota bacterium]|nr:hypothetical protein [Acidobacteriota bacterium]